VALAKNWLREARSLPLAVLISCPNEFASKIFQRAGFDRDPMKEACTLACAPRRFPEESFMSMGDALKQWK
jgi:hypothetical protein